MKKFLISFLSILSYVYSNAQNPGWTPNQTIPLWQKRQVPTASNVDSTFSSIMFKSEKDSFSYAPPQTYRYSAAYGAGTMDSTAIAVAPVYDVANLTYIGTKFTAGDNAGYPAYTACTNVIQVSVTDNSYFDPTDTLNVKITFDAYTPTGATSVDSVKILIYTSSKLGAGSETSTTIRRIDNPTNTWGSYYATLQITAPAVSNNQTIFIIVEPKFGAKNDTCTIANVAAKIYN